MADIPVHNRNLDFLDKGSVNTNVIGTPPLPTGVTPPVGTPVPPPSPTNILDGIFSNLQRTTAAANPYFKSIGINQPIQTPLAQTMRYNSSTYGFDPLNPNIEAQYGDRQGALETWKNNLIKFGANGINAFITGITSIPIVIDAAISGKPSKAYDNPSANWAAQLVENANIAFPTYQNSAQRDHPITSWLPFSGGFANNWGTLLNNLGFTAGAIASAILTDVAVAAVTGGAGAVPLLGPQIMKAFGKLGKFYTAEKGAITGVGEGLTHVNDVYKAIDVASKNIKIADRFRYGIAIGTAAFGESVVEANETNRTINESLKEKYREIHGHDATDKELAKIESYARSGANADLFVNLALLTATEGAVFGNLFRPIGAARKAVSASIMGADDIALKAGSLDVFEAAKAASKSKFNVLGIFDKATRPIRVASIEGFQEGAQFWTQRSAEDFYKRKFDKPATDSVDNFVKSLSTGLSDTLTTREGLESIFMGLLSGVVINGARSVIEKKKGIDSNKNSLINSTLAILNRQRLSGLFSTTHNEAVTAESIKEDMAKAIAKNDLFEFKNLKFQQLFNFIESGIRSNRYDLRMDQLNMLKDLKPEEFESMFGLNFSDENKKSVNAFVDTVISKAEDIKATHDKVDRLFTNPYKPNTREHLIYNEYKSQLNLALSDAKDNKRRLTQLENEVSIIAPGVPFQDLMNLTNDKGLSEVIIGFQKRVDELSDNIENFLEDKNSDFYKDQVKERAYLQKKIVDIKDSLEDYNEDEYKKHAHDIINYFANGKKVNGPNRISNIDLHDILVKGQDAFKLISNMDSALYHYQQLTEKKGFEKNWEDLVSEYNKQDARLEIIDPFEPEDKKQPPFRDDEENPDVQNLDDKGDPISPKKPSPPPPPADTPSGPNLSTETTDPDGYYPGAERNKEEIDRLRAMKPETEADAAIIRGTIISLEQDEDQPFDEATVNDGRNAWKAQKQAEREVEEQAAIAKEEKEQQRDGAVKSTNGMVADPRVLFNKLYSVNHPDSPQKDNLRELATAKNPKQVADTITLTVSKSTQGVKKGDFHKFPGLPNIIYTGYDTDMQIMNGDKIVGLIQPADRLYFRRKGVGAPVKLYDITLEEYAEVTGNDVSTYTDFINQLNSHRSITDTIQENFKNGKTTYTNEEVKSLFDIVINYGGIKFSSSEATATPLNQLKYKGKGSAILSFPMVYNKETRSFRRSSRPEILNKKELSKQEIDDVLNHLKNNVDDILKINSRYIYLMKFPDGTFKKNSAIATRPIAATEAVLSNIFNDITKKLEKSVDAAVLLKLNADLKEKVYIADSRNAKGSKTKMYLVADKLGALYLNIYNEVSNLHKRVNVSEAKNARNFDEMVDKINQKLQSVAQSSPSIEKLNLVLTRKDFKAGVLNDENVTRKELDNSLSVAISPDVFSVGDDARYQISLAVYKASGKPVSKPTKATPAPAAPATPTPAPAKPAPAKPAPVVVNPAPIVPVLTANEQSLLKVVQANLKDIKGEYKKGIEIMIKDPSLHPDILSTIISQYIDNWEVARGIFGKAISDEIIKTVPEAAKAEQENIKTFQVAKNKTSLISIFRTLFGLPVKQANAVASIFDRVAASWAKRTGKSQQDFYKQISYAKSTYAELEAKKNAGENILPQDTDPLLKEIFRLKNSNSFKFIPETGQVARERFNIPKLEKNKIGEGSDRDVFDIGDGKVVKIAKTARGLRQNMFEGMDDYISSRLLPVVYERGANYVVVEKLKPLGTKEAWVSSMIKRAEALSAKVQYGTFRNDTKLVNETADELDALLIKHGMGLYGESDILWGDFANEDNWGVAEDGSVMLSDAGTLAGRSLIEDYKGKKDLNDKDFKEIYDKSNELYDKYGDRDSNTNYQIIGEKAAKNLVYQKPDILSNLIQAQFLEEKKVSSKKIYLATGWERGVDEKWKYDLPDSLKIKIPLNKIDKNKLTNLEDIIYYPDLFTAYPSLKKLKVLVETSNITGAYYGKAGVHDTPENFQKYFNKSKDHYIAFSKSALKLEDTLLKRILLHELQHAVQQEEGFAEGSNPVDYNSDMYRRLNSNVFELIDKFTDGYFDGIPIQNYISSDTKVKLRNKGNGVFIEDKAYLPTHLFEGVDKTKPFTSKSFLTFFNNYEKWKRFQNPNAIYKRVAGEVEARNVEIRSLMKLKDRLKIPISETEDTKRDNQRVLFQQTNLSNSAMIANVVKGFNLIKSKGYGLAFQTKTGQATPLLAKKINEWLKNNGYGDTLKFVYENTYGTVNPFINEGNTLFQKTEHTNEESLLELEMMIEELGDEKLSGNFEFQDILLKALRIPEIMNGYIGWRKYFNVVTDLDTIIGIYGHIKEEEGYTQQESVLKELLQVIKNHIKDRAAKPEFLNQDAHAAIKLMKDGTAIMYALTNPNASSPLHELAHFWFDHLTAEELSKVTAWTGTTDYIESTEKFARGFEKYLAEGVAPTPELQTLFDQFKKWLTDIYTAIVGSAIDIKLNDEMRTIYATMLGVNFETAVKQEVEQQKVEEQKQEEIKIEVPVQTSEEQVEQEEEAAAPIFTTEDVGSKVMYKGKELTVSDVITMGSGRVLVEVTDGTKYGQQNVEPKDLIKLEKVTTPIYAVKEIVSYNGSDFAIESIGEDENGDYLYNISNGTIKYTVKEKDVNPKQKSTINTLLHENEDEGLLSDININTEKRFSEKNDGPYSNEADDNNLLIDYIGLKFILETLKLKTGIPYIVVSSEEEWSGRFENGKVVININKVTRATPFHEYLHPFLAVLKVDNPKLYMNLREEFDALILDGDKEAGDILDAVIDNDYYSDKTKEEQRDEALIRLIAQGSAKNVNKQGKLVNKKFSDAYKRLVKKFNDWLTKVLQGWGWIEGGKEKFTKYGKPTGKFTEGKEGIIPEKAGITSVEYLPTNMNIQDIADFYSLNSVALDFSNQAELIAKIDAFEAVLEKASPEKAIIDRIKRRLRVLQDTANNRTPNDVLSSQVGAVTNILKNEDEIESLNNYIRQGLNGIDYANDEFARIDAVLKLTRGEIPIDEDNKESTAKLYKQYFVQDGKLTPASIREMNKNLSMVKNLLAFYEDVHVLFRRIVKDEEGNEISRYKEFNNILDQSLLVEKKINSMSVDLTTEWLYPHIEEFNAKIEERYPEYALTKEQFKQKLYSADKDTDFWHFLVGSVSSSSDPVNAVVRTALFDLMEENHLFEAELGENIKLSYDSFLRKTGLKNEVKETEDYYAKNFLRKASVLERTDEKDEEGKYKYAYKDKWAFHEQYFYDLYVKEKDAFFETLEKHFNKPLNELTAPEQGDLFNMILEWEAVNGTLSKPADRFKNNEWSALQNNEFFKVLYNAYRDGNNKIPEYEQLKFGVIPQVSKGNSTSNIKNAEGVKGKAKAVVTNIKNFLLPKMEEESTSSDTQKNLDGTLYRKMVVPYIHSLDESDISLVLPETVFKFAGAANLHATMKESEANITTLKNVIEGNSKFIQEGRKINKVTSDRKTIWDSILKLPASKEKRLSRLNDQLIEWIDDAVYGVNEIQDSFNILGKSIDLNKLGANLSFLTALNNMAFNITAGIGNVTIGNVMSLGESMGGKYYSPSDWATGQKQYFGNFKDFMKDVFDLKKSKVTQLGIKYDAIQGEFRDKFGKKFVGNVAQKYATSDTFFIVNHAAEHQIQLVGMLSLMNATKVKTKDGKTISLYDAHVINNKGFLRLREDIEWTKEQEIDFTRKLHGINKMLNGNYSKFDKVHLQRTWYGKLVLIYRKFMYTSFRARYGKQRPDYEVGDVMEGYYRQFIKKVAADIKEYKFDAASRFFRKEGWTPDEQYAANKTLYELSLLVGMIILGIAVSAAEDGDDDKSWGANYLTLQMLRLRNDIGMYTIFGLTDMMRVIQNPSAVVLTLKNYGGFISQLAIGPFDTYDKKTGAFDKGDSKLKAKLLKAIPIVRQFVNLLQPEEQIKFYKLLNKY